MTRVHFKYVLSNSLWWMGAEENVVMRTVLEYCAVLDYLLHVAVK